MRSLLGGFSNLPTPLKAAAALLTGASVIGVLFLYVNDRRVLTIMLIGFLVVGLLLVLYGRMLKWRRKRKGDALSRNIEASAPSGALRQKFEEGMSKFRQAGKDLYSVPWFLLVGESGSGKTEVVRRSQLRFPPGLQDYLQGMGGTRDMHWWFTADAVVIDTAGRMFIAESDEAQEREEDRRLWDMQWEEFLKLLNSNRANCPINGLLLVLPADKLIQDSAEELERKGRAIAKQFDAIQRMLDIRFPVFVILTKCDLVLGFREFFEHVNDPVLQHQMLGWSNPHSLDEPFQPQELVSHFESVLQRVRKRRMTLLQDPRPADRDSRRLTEVDSLFSFPESLAKVIPRLMRYLEIIFAGSEWSPKPLFLRGIYLNSSMREGSAIDADLAEALGVPVESLPEGRAWEKERAFFIRDFFTEKAFKESGLVTRATNTRRQYHGRRASLLTGGLLSVLLLLFLTWYWARSFEESIGIHSQYWRVAADEANWVASGDQTYFTPIVSPEVRGGTTYGYNAAASIKLGDKMLSASQFHARLANLVEMGIRAPRIFYAASLDLDFDEPRARAQRVLFERGVMQPLVDAVRHRLAAEDEQALSDEAVAMLSELIRVEALALGIGRFSTSVVNTTDLAEWFRYVLLGGGGGKAWEHYNGDPHREELQRLLDDLHGTEGSWPPAWLADGMTAAGGELVVSHPLQHSYSLFVDRMCSVEYLQRLGATADTLSLLQRIELLRAACDGLGEAESELLALDDDYVGKENFQGLLKRLTLPEFEHAYAKWKTTYTQDLGSVLGRVTVEQFRDIVRNWREAYARYVESKAGVDAALAEIALKDGDALSALYREGVDRQVTSVEAKRGILAQLRLDADAMAETSGKGELTQAQAAFCSWLDAELSSSLKDAGERLLSEVAVSKYEQVDTRFLGPKIELEGAEGERVYQLRCLMYGIANKELSDVASAQGLSDEVKKLVALAPDRYRCAEAADLAGFMSNLASASHDHDELRRGADGLKTSVGAIEALVRAGAGGAEAGPEIPFTAFRGEPFDSTYDATAARAVLADWKGVAEQLKRETLVVLEGDKIRQDFGVAAQHYEAYLGAYINYWCTRVPMGLLDMGQLGWRQSDLQPFRTRQAWQVRKGIEDLCRALESALAGVEDCLGAELPREVADVKARVKATRELLQGETRELVATSAFDGQCRKVWSAWAELDEDPVRARNALLEKEPTELLAGYFVLPLSSAANYATPYWEKLTLSLLGAVSRRLSAIAQEAVVELESAHRFPLSVPGQTGEQLSVEAFRRSCALIGRVWPVEALSADGTVGRGKNTGIEPIDAHLARLRRPALNDRQQEWLVRAQAVIGALSKPDAPGRVLKCRVSVAAVPARTGNQAALVYDMWRVVELSQGERSLGKSRTDRRQEQHLGEVLYPGEPLRLRFYRFLDDATADREATVAGPWSCVRLLFAGPSGAGGGGGAARWGTATTQDGRVWLCPITVRDAEGTDRSFSLRVEFERELPLQDKWPSG